ncbi:MAG: hypothetical protein GX627_02705 [Parcubacteria group bacterium]|jgi:hypothetical protein|nr:hypothetical protein [Parcubacteria group bacterium]
MKNLKKILLAMVIVVGLVAIFFMPRFKNVDNQDMAWQVFQKYLSYNKIQDLEGVKNIVYKVSPVCENEETLADCKTRMSNAYAYGSALKKEDFVNVWSDEKQIILATDFWTESIPALDQYGRFRSLIFLIKDDDGEWKLLSFSPTAGGVTAKGSATEEEINERIVRYTEDNDQDGRPDYEEECLSVKEGQVCIATDPKLRDTDGDGFWDGVQVLIEAMK